MPNTPKLMYSRKCFYYQYKQLGEGLEAFDSYLKITELFQGYNTPSKTGNFKNQKVNSM